MTWNVYTGKFSSPEECRETQVKLNASGFPGRIFALDGFWGLRVLSMGSEQNAKDVCVLLKDAGFEPYVLNI